MMVQVDTLAVDLFIVRKINTQDKADKLSDDVIEAVESVKFEEHDLACTLGCPPPSKPLWWLRLWQFRDMLRNKFGARLREWPKFWQWADIWILPSFECYLTHRIELVVQSNRLSDGRCEDIEEEDVDGLSEALQKIEGFDSHDISASTYLKG